MATFARSAPVPELIDEHAAAAMSLTLKMLDAIPETHKSCITHPDNFDLNSTEKNNNLMGMAGHIGIPSSPVLKAITQDFTMEMSLKTMSEGLQIYQALLNDNEVFPTERVDGLLGDIRDILTHIHTVVEPHIQPTLKLNFPVENKSWQVQVARHFTLLQLRNFGIDMERNLRSILPDNDMD